MSGRTLGLIQRFVSARTDPAALIHVKAAAVSERHRHPTGRPPEDDVLERKNNEDRQRTASAMVVETIERGYVEALRFCDMLEEIADTLPDRVDRFKCLTIANALSPLLDSVHQFEEEVVFPIYAARCGGSDCSASLRRLSNEHVADECFADELTEVLLTIGHGAPVENPETVGFMLRGFFESVRRHIAFEREHILPVIAGRNQPQDS
jgi:hemerythrin-like domain-containing protein